MWPADPVTYAYSIIKWSFREQGIWEILAPQSSKTNHLFQLFYHRRYHAPAWFDKTAVLPDGSNSPSTKCSQPLFWYEKLVV